MTNLVKRFVKDEEGATMVEYGILVGLISIAALAAIVLIGPELLRIFQAVADKLTAVKTT